MFPDFELSTQYMTPNYQDAIMLPHILHDQNLSTVIFQLQIHTGEVWDFSIRVKSSNWRFVLYHIIMPYNFC